MQAFELLHYNDRLIFSISLKTYTLNIRTQNIRGTSLCNRDLVSGFYVVSKIEKNEQFLEKRVKRDILISCR